MGGSRPARRSQCWRSKSWLMGMIGAQPLPVRSWRSHPDKHVGSASFLLRKRYQAALREVLEETGAVDLDDQIRFLSTPSQVTSELAKDHLNFARDVLATLRSISLIWTASQR